MTAEFCVVYSHIVGFPQYRCTVLLYTSSQYFYT